MSRLELVRLMPMMGNAENVTRSMSVEAVAGRSLRICESRPSTYSSDCAMSTCQLKKTLICAEPRLVAERTVIAPGMSFIASSMGRVTVAIISSAGMMPLFTMMTTRGKIRLRKNRRRHAQRRQNTRQAQRHRDERDGQRVPRGEPAQGRNDVGLHCAFRRSGVSAERRHFGSESRRSAEAPLEDNVVSHHGFTTRILVFSGRP